VRDIGRVVSAVKQGGFEPLRPVQGVEDGPLKGPSIVYVRDPDGVALEPL
jgi:hypothetical protein